MLHSFAIPGPCHRNQTWLYNEEVDDAKTSDQRLSYQQTPWVWTRSGIKLTSMRCCRSARRCWGLKAGRTLRVSPLRTGSLWESEGLTVALTRIVHCVSYMSAWANKLKLRLEWNGTNSKSTPLMCNWGGNSSRLVGGPPNILVEAWSGIWTSYPDKFCADSKGWSYFNLLYKAEVQRELSWPAALKIAYSILEI